ncbi:MAG: hypothetical protein Q8P18_26840 [Pseudomonadota bacterium]|nr:hypothetical protein [Pseudomonadota bacterium]
MRASTLVILMLSFPAAAYETDQLTARDQPLEDGLALANARVNELFVTAVERVNQRTRCKASDERTRRVLATDRGWTVFSRAAPYDAEPVGIVVVA